MKLSSRIYSVFSGLSTSLLVGAFTLFGPAAQAKLGESCQGPRYIRQSGGCVTQLQTNKQAYLYTVQTGYGETFRVYDVALKTSFPRLRDLHVVHMVEPAMRALRTDLQLNLGGLGKASYGQQGSLRFALAPLTIAHPTKKTHAVLMVMFNDANAQMRVLVVEATSRDFAIRMAQTLAGKISS